jgi:eukaryotic-like serine/threonine-protein kinase
VPGESTRTEFEQTAEGTIVGSAPYMSPEQAEGRVVDARTDIFSVGAVLYEMCTGRPAFAGDTPVSTLAAVLTKDPTPIEEMAPNTPKELTRVISRCLQKDARRRFQSMLDLKLTLEEVKSDIDSGRLTGAQVNAAKSRVSWAVMTGAAVLAAVVLAGAWLWWRWERGRIRPLALEQVTFDGGLTTNPAISPDGKLIAYASDRAGEGNLDIWVQYRGGEPVRITRDPADEDEPSFSPDGTRIAYQSSKDGGGIYVVSSLGGEQPQQVANFGSRPRFSPDGTEILFETGGYAPLSQVYRVKAAAGGAAPRQLVPEFRTSLRPLWSPDGRYILFIGSRGANEGFDYWVVAKEGGAPERVSIAGAEIMALGYPTAWLVGDRVIGEGEFGSRVHLFEARLRRKPWRVDRAEQITFGTGMAEGASVAVDGSMVVSNEETDLDLWSLPLNAEGRVTGEAKRLTGDASREQFPSISVDGMKLTYSSVMADQVRIWFVDLRSGEKRPLTPASRTIDRPALSMDGSRVAYMDFAERKSMVRLIPTSGSAPDHVVARGPQVVWDWAPDGHTLLVMDEAGPPLTADLADIAAGKVLPFLKRPHDVFQTHISHDGRWAIAQEASVGVLITSYDANYPQKTSWRSLGLQAADLIRWSPDDNIIYFIANTDGFRCIWGQRLDPASKQLCGEPFAVTHFHQARRSLRIADTGEIGLAVARDKVVVAEAERTGNVWLTKLQ